MYDTDSRGISWTAGFFMLIAFTIAGLMVAGQLAGPLWTAMTGKGVEVMRDGPWTHTDSRAMQVAQAVTTLLGFLLPTIITAAMLSRRPGRLLGFAGSSSGRQIGLVILIILAALIFSTAFSYLNHQLPVPANWKAAFDRMEEKYNRQVEAILNLQAGNGSGYVLALMIMAFLPALCEETLFRGGLQNFLSRATKRPWLSIVIISVLFSLAHFSYYGFLYRFFLGMVLGAIYYYSGRLRLCILAHFLHNAVGLTVVYTYVQQGKPMREALEMEATGYWGFLALPLVIGLFILFKKTTAARQPV
ncbi:MAG: CPBP family intramembrane glutamic endopeptidase [Chitinophagaceae bacterium]